MHQTVGNLLRTLLHTNPPQNIVDANALIETALATASRALHATVHHTLGLSPGAIVFARNMLLGVPCVADLVQLRDKHQ
jgi:hypothetical protein